MNHDAVTDYDLGLPLPLAPLEERRRAIPAEIWARLGRTRSALEALLGSRLRLLRLFGSYARGDFDEESDLDLLVLVDRLSSADSDAIVSAVLNAGGPIVSPLILEEAQFQRLRDLERLIAQDIDLQGISL